MAVLTAFSEGASGVQLHRWLRSLIEGATVKVWHTQANSVKRCMRDHFCPFCQSDQTEAISYSEEVKIGSRKVRITDIKKMRCRACTSDFVSGPLHDENLARTRSAIENTCGAVSPAMLRTFREDWNFSQKDASALFGAGSRAFATWESGQAEPCTPSALLLQAAMKFPQVTTHLAQLANVKLSKEPQGSGCQVHRQQ